MCTWPVRRPVTENGTAGAPSFRWDAALAWDSVHNQLLVADGYDDSNNFDELWAYSVSQGRWQQLTPGGTHPAARHGASLVFDPNDDVALLVSGSGASGNLTDHGIG